MESGYSCSRLRMSCLSHRGQCHERLEEKRFQRALDSSKWGHGSVSMEIRVWVLAWDQGFEWLCLLLWVCGVVEVVEMRILDHAWLAVGTVGDVGLEEGILPMDPGSLGKGSQCNLTFLL